jgi:hypothetical protein
VTTCCSEYNLDIMPTSPQEPLTPAWNERHYSPKELAAIFNVSSDSIIRLFRNEPGVLLLHPPRRRGVRRKITMRIPESVVERVYRRVGGG